MTAAGLMDGFAVIVDHDAGVGFCECRRYVGSECSKGNEVGIQMDGSDVGVWGKVAL